MSNQQRQEQNQQPLSMDKIPFFHPEACDDNESVEVVVEATQCSTDVCLNESASQPASPLVTHSDHFKEQLDELEEFCIGCGCGLVGAIVSFAFVTFGTSVWSVIIWGLVLPFLLLEVVEAWFHFSAATQKHESPLIWKHVLLQTALRKRLARQSYGQGVLSGRAVLGYCALQQSLADITDYIITGCIYVLIWMVWMMLCRHYNNLPPQDFIQNAIRTSPAPKQRRMSRNTSPSSRSSTRQKAAPKYRKLRRGRSAISYGSDDDMSQVDSSAPRRFRRKFMNKI